MPIPAMQCAKQWREQCCLGNIIFLKNEHIEAHASRFAYHETQVLLNESDRAANNKQYP